MKLYTWTLAAGTVVAGPAWAQDEQCLDYSPLIGIDSEAILKAEGKPTAETPTADQKGKILTWVDATNGSAMVVTVDGDGIVQTFDVTPNWLETHEIPLEVYSPPPF